MTELHIHGATTEVRILILEKLAAGWTLDEAYPETARRRGLTRPQMGEIAQHYGYPDRAVLGGALQKLRAAAPPPPPPPPPLAVPSRLKEAPMTTTAPAARIVPATAPARLPAPPPARGQLLEVPVEALTPDPRNPREHLGDVDDLARSMESVGLLQPIVARGKPGETLIVVAGHRRLAAAKKLGWRTVPVILRRDLRPDHVLVAMYVENSQRVDLDPIEEARALNHIRALNGDCPVSRLATIVGRSQPHISGRLALLALPVEQQDALRSGQLTLGQAQQAARMVAGTARPAGYTGHWYLGAEHTLADRARARCKRAHPKARLIGATACGECWETVIRADERQHIHGHSARTGQCAICSGPYGAATTEPAEQSV